MLKVIKEKWDFKKMIVILILLFLFDSKSVYGYNNLDYDEIQDVVDDIFKDKNDFDFGKLVGELIRGDSNLSLRRRKAHHR